MSRLAWLALAIATHAQAALPQTLSLDEALQVAHDRQPALRLARAQVDVSSARARETLASVLPTVSMALLYSRQTSNFVGRPSTVPQNTSAASTLSFDSADFWSGNLTAQATLWDFGQGWNRYQSALSTRDAQEAQQRASEVATALQVRTAWFNVLAQHELVDVAKATLQNTQAHFEQVKGFVEVGTRPEIDLAQSKAERANARLALLNTTNAYLVAKAKVNQAIGLEGPAGWEAVGEPPPAQDAENASSDVLFEQALGGRPEAAALEAQLNASQLALRSVRAGYLPTLGIQLGATAGALTLSKPVPNLSGQLTLGWQLYQGGLTGALAIENEAAIVGLQAQRDTLRLQVRLDVEQALLGVKAARESVDVAQEALEASVERLRLAEGRYQAGAGSALERGDAQVAQTSAAAQRVQAVYGLAIARAQLSAALGLQ